MRYGMWLLAAMAWFGGLSAASVRAGDSAEIDWDPETTTVFIVGILEWERSDLYGAFPDCMPNRRDQQLADFFREAGVPDDRLVYLQDAEATKKRIKKELVEVDVTLPLWDQIRPAGGGDLTKVAFCLEHTPLPGTRVHTSGRREEGIKIRN